MGTMDSTAFNESGRDDGSGKTDIYFNGPGDGPNHGHVVQHTDPNGEVVYDYVRDVEGNVYVDRG